MNVKYTFNTKKSANFIIILGAICFLASCSSSNKVASSFGKRKYSKGHFSDAVARLNSERASDGVNTKAALISQPQQTLEVQKAIVSSKTITADVKPAFSAPAKSVAATHATQHKAVVTTIAKTATMYANENVSVKQTASYQDSQANIGGDKNDRGEHGHHYLFDCLLFVLISILLGILGVALISPLVLLLAYIAGIAALVFFILWIISIAG